MRILGPAALLLPLLLTLTVIPGLAGPAGPEPRPAPAGQQALLARFRMI